MRRQGIWAIGVGMLVLALTGGVIAFAAGSGEPEPTALEQAEARAETKSPPISACAVFESCVTASSSVTPWLVRWETEMGPVARRHLTDSPGWWREELTSDDSPFTWWGHRGRGAGRLA